MTNLCDSDKALWDAYITEVTPLNQPHAQPSNYHPGIELLPPLPEPIAHTLDLHGLTVAKAYETTMAFIEATKDIYKMVTVITGRRGTIQREFHSWFDNHPRVRRIEQTNGGAYCLHFKKP
jgi:hypothetical protein